MQGETLMQRGTNTGLTCCLLTSNGSFYRSIKEIANLNVAQSTASLCQNEMYMYITANVNINQ